MGMRKRPRIKNSEKEIVNCSNCNKDFLSNDKALNRVCPTCKTSKAWKDGEAISEIGNRVSLDISNVGIGYTNSQKIINYEKEVKKVEKTAVSFVKELSEKAIEANSYAHFFISVDTYNKIQTGNCELGLISSLANTNVRISKDLKGQSIYGFLNKESRDDFAETFLNALSHFGNYKKAIETAKLELIEPSHYWAEYKI